MRRLLTIWLLLAASLGWAGTCGNGYSKRYYIVVPHQNVYVGTQTNFPVPLAFNGASIAAHTLPALKTVANGGSVNNTVNNSLSRLEPADVVFSDAAVNGNCLKYEGVGYVATTGKWEVYVQKTLSNSVDTGFWMFVGNNSVSTDQEDLSLWGDINAVFVGHYPDGTTLDIKDSSGVAGAATSTGPPTATTGIIDGAMSVSPSQRANYASNTNMNTLTGWTMETYVHPTSLSGVVFILDKGSASSGTQFLLGHQSGTAWCEYFDGADHLALTGGLTNNVDQYFSCVWNAATIQMYISNTAGLNAQTPAAFSTTPLTANTNPLTVGARDTGNGFTGWIDEVRYFKDAKSLGWEQTSYYSITAPQGFTILVDANTPSGLTSGAYCIPITIDHTQVPTSDVTNMQVLVRGQYPWMATIANGGLSANASGYDIRYYSNNTCTSLLPFERVYWTAATGDSAFRVLVSPVSHTVDTPFYVSIGNATFTSDAQNVSGTWPAPWVGVFHLGSPTSIILTDSGTGGITLSSGGSPAAIATPLGGGVSFASATSDTLGFTALNADTISSRGYPIGSAVRHISCWAQIHVGGDCTNDCTYFGWGKSNTGGDLGGYVLQNELRSANTNAIIGMASNAGFSAAAGTQIYSQTGSTPAMRLIDYGWHKIEHDYPTAAGATSTSTVTIDGVSVATPGSVNPSSVINTTNGSTLGVDQAEVRVARDPGHGAGFGNDTLADCMATSTSIGADERTARYNNELAPFTFYSFGAGAPVATTSVRHRVTNQ
jgi:hypothetical protein